MTPGGVDANAQNLGIVCGELVELSTVRRHLLGSSRRPVEGIERQNYVLLPPEVAQAHLMTPVARDRWKFEIRGCAANFKHCISSALTSRCLALAVLGTRQVGSPILTGRSGDHQLTWQQFRGRNVKGELKAPIP